MKALRIGRTAAAVLFLCLDLSGCKGILGSRPLQVISWTPSEERVIDPEFCVVSVTFSAETDRVRTEEAFSIAAEGAQPPGKTRWEETTLFYEPYHPLEAGMKYILKVTTGAEDLVGNSLREDFVLVFYTGEEGFRPTVMGIDPPDRADITDLYRTITITFDTPVDVDSFLSSFSLSPSVKGVWTFQNENTVGLFTPAEPYTWQEKYTLTLSEDLRSSKGYPLAETFESRFHIGSEDEEPYVVRIISEDSGIEVIPSPPDSPEAKVNSAWEKDTGLKIAFSEEVHRESAETSLVIEPDMPYLVVWDESLEPAEMVITWEESLEWHNLYRIELSTALEDLQGNRMEEPVVCYLYVDGPSSKPPIIERVEFVPDETTPVLFFDYDSPGNNLYSHTILDTSSGMDVKQDPFYLDYYITLAEGAELPFFSFVENFSLIPENSCVSVQYLAFQVFNPGDDLMAAELPKPAPAGGQAVVRLIISLTDDWDTADTISFRVYSDLKDSLGNNMEEDWLWELFDEDN
ncbi:MAG: Ig-like domain-containing protein [Spirochaetales bacterium]|nr:Ig-like domain-containing protein [Spirochaetales bacterium]